jgi:CRISPR-associated protein Cas2
MADRPMLTVFAYDISRDRVRARVAALLEDHAVRVQNSVFEANLTHSAANRLFSRLAALLEPGDRLRMYGISATGRARCRAHGGTPLPENGDFWLV